MKIALASNNMPAEQTEGIFTFQFSEPPEAFMNKFKSIYGQPPAYVGDIAYDIIYALKRAIEMNGRESTEVQQALHKIDFAGISGRIYLDKNNFPANKHSVVEKSANGKFILIE